MSDVAGVKVERVAVTRDDASYVITVDGNQLDTVEFVRYYEPAVKAMEPYVALWAGPTLCVIDRQLGKVRCIDRDDETHHIHALGTAWIIEGELRIDLFDPADGTVVATYDHHEVITSCSVTDGLVYIRDFAGAAVTLDPRRSLQVVDVAPPARQ